jgi:hypothetical protein
MLIERLFKTGRKFLGFKYPQKDFEHIATGKWEKMGGPMALGFFEPNPEEMMLKMDKGKPGAAPF